jgi:hypothetical protein
MSRVECRSPSAPPRLPPARHRPRDVICGPWSRRMVGERWPERQQRGVMDGLLRTRRRDARSRCERRRRERDRVREGNRRRGQRRHADIRSRGVRDLDLTARILQALHEAGRAVTAGDHRGEISTRFFWKKEGAPTPPVRECAAPASSCRSSAPTSSNSQPPIGGRQSHRALDNLSSRPCGPWVPDLSSLNARSSGTRNTDLGLARDRQSKCAQVG